MIVPQYWAEGRAQGKQGDRQVTVRRFGWSNESQADAQEMADARSRDALQHVFSWVDGARREPRIPYNGAEGVPIREEVVERHGETVITRNAYGARCLNTPNVLFADIDFEGPRTGRFVGAIGLLTGAAAIYAGWHLRSMAIGGVLVILALVISRVLAGILSRSAQGKPNPSEKVACDRVRAVFKVNPEWGGRLYRTPAGLRVLVTHRIFEPSDPDVKECFDLFGVDPVYERMCLNQQCFRARLTGKPWRVGIPDHMRPRPGTWPVAPERMTLRQGWIDRYEAAAASFAACAFIESLGNGAVHPDIAPVQALHDDLSKATSGLPIA